jgi:hypothetical protein
MCAAICLKVWIGHTRRGRIASINLALTSVSLAMRPAQPRFSLVTNPGVAMIGKKHSNLPAGLGRRSSRATS